MPQVHKMTRRKTIQGVLENFLGTYTSRYSNHRGYWLFGILVEDLERLDVDLLQPEPPMGDSVKTRGAATLAALKFNEQVKKAGVALSQIREARLSLTRLTGTMEGIVNGRARTGYTLHFVATAVTDLGRAFRCERSVFAAPHDALLESRSTHRTLLWKDRWWHWLWS